MLHLIWEIIVREMLIDYMGQRSSDYNYLFVVILISFTVSFMTNYAHYDFDANYQGHICYPQLMKVLE